MNISALGPQYNVKGDPLLSTHAMVSLLLFGQPLIYDTGASASGASICQLDVKMRSQKSLI